jgi:hypothetical protein
MLLLSSRQLCLPQHLRNIRLKFSVQFLISFIHTTGPAHLIIIEFIILLVCGQRLRALWDSGLRKLVGPEREKVTGK